MSIPLREMLPKLQSDESSFLGKLVRLVTTVSTTALRYLNANIDFEERVTRWADKFCLPLDMRGGRGFLVCLQVGGRLGHIQTNSPSGETKACVVPNASMQARSGNFPRAIIGS